MSLVSGPASFQRFFIGGRFFEQVSDALVDALRQRAFGRVPPAPDDIQTGWIGPRHVLQDQIEAEQIAFGSYVLVAVRVDRLRPPPSLLRAYVQIEEQAARAASGREFLSTGERRRAREAALARVEAEVRSGTFRRLAAYPVLLDLPAKVAYLGGLSSTLADRFMVLFSETFGCAVEPADPPRVAERLLTPHRSVRSLEHLPPFHLIRPPHDSADPGGFRHELSFLGREFLTWLWYRSEADDGPVALCGKDELLVTVERGMRLICDFGLSGSTTVCADAPARAPEARAAVRIGKQPVRMGLTLGAPAGEFRLTLDGPRLAVSGLVVPEPPADADERARLEHRFDAIADAAGLVDALFERFLLLRVSRDWNAELRRMTAWAADRKPERASQAASA